MRQSRHRLLPHIADARHSYVHWLWRLFTPSSCTALAVRLPDIQLDAFKICTVSASFKLQISQHAIGLLFGELFGSLIATASHSLRVVSDVSIFCIIIWLAYSSVVTVRFSSLLRTIVTDATAYFIMAMALQVLVVSFLSFADVCRRPRLSLHS